ncbi:hypothetical protein ASF70_12745 [Rhizobium sp. Leaf321]|uniref:hypothetical protein n=1 Tax=Rhizobium sp. Leaf321 TaxID=1736335 RepID=UPI0007156453|nr:hypothetical protein [Rhizobium sp. Leaf321]KQQ72396.1 hypothetical protein ASF70_12745 [Rhizobium sp. Leaf321]
MATIDFFHYANHRSPNGIVRTVRTKLPVRVVDDSRWWRPEVWSKIMLDAVKAAGLNVDDCVIKHGDTRAKSERPIVVMRVEFGRSTGVVEYPLTSQVVYDRVRGSMERQRKQRQLKLQRTEQVSV